MRRAAGLTAALLAVAGCTTTALTDPAPVTGGDPERGRLLITELGCAACHQIPGIDQPQGSVGPPLAEFAERRAVAGQLPNTPENAAAWIRDPQRVEPDTLMPDLGVSEREARDIVAYLYTLE
jgi:cytochrome c